MNVYSGLKSTASNRHLDGWQNLITAQETGKKVGKKLRQNADVELDDELDEEPKDVFKENAEFFQSSDD